MEERRKSRERCRWWGEVGRDADWEACGVLE
jgi:hypothetical protein